MNHEPECPHTTHPDLPKWRTFIDDGEVFLDCTFCTVSRAAYQRGREDARMMRDKGVPYHEIAEATHLNWTNVKIALGLDPDEELS
jgi:hypothetical protein